MRTAAFEALRGAHNCRRSHGMPSSFRRKRRKTSNENRLDPRVATYSSKYDVSAHSLLIGNPEDIAHSGGSRTLIEAPCAQPVNRRRTWNSNSLGRRSRVCAPLSNSQVVKQKPGRCSASVVNLV